MFGHYTKSLDKKNRVIIPSKYRHELGNTFFITAGPDKILELRDAKSFNLWKDKLLSNNMLNANARKFARILLGNSAEVNIDNQGRVIIPSNLLQIAAITTEVTFVGVGNKVELWNAKNFKDFQTSISDGESLEELAQKLLKDGAGY